MVPVWKVEFDAAATRELRKSAAAPRSLILRYLRERIATIEDPRRFGKALGGELSGLWGYRIGDHRVICKIEESVVIVLVVRIGHRREVYD